MKKNNKGFIAISLIYSFFLVFLITLLMIVRDYAHNRILLNDVKIETQEYLNGLAEFNPVSLENRNYEVNEEIKFGNENWKVLQDVGANVVLVLNRILSKEEIEKTLSNVGLPGLNANEAISMCKNGYNPVICNYQDSVTFNYYTWGTSIVKKVVEDWLSTDATLQKAIQIGSLQSMTYSDGIKNYNSFIRIPIESEFSIVNDEGIWYLTSSSNMAGISYLKIGPNTISSHNNYKSIKPVIMVKKATT